MYFETSPKSRKEDFFNYNYEYDSLKKAIERKDKLIAVVGVRRVGKTSLLNIVYNEIKSLKMWLDGRIISSPKKEIFSAIYQIAKEGKPKIFGKVESLNISAFGIGLDVKLTSENMFEIEKTIKKSGQIYVFIDEAQRMKIKELADVLSYFYDRFPNVSFIISGSEIGLLEQIIGRDKSDHPLYGRSWIKIQMERLDQNKSIEFLSKGFDQVNFKAKKDEITQVSLELGGLIGWLTLYGYERAVIKDKTALQKTIQVAAQITASELINFLKISKNKKLYLSILRNCKDLTWNELKNKTENEMRSTINSNSFTQAINRLSIYSFIENKNGKYKLTDPLILKATFLI